MVERIFLTQKVVDNAEAPETGERWIADTQIRGFGLRLWRTEKGTAGKAYCVRVTNISGKAIRRTLSYWNALERYRKQQGRRFDYYHWFDITLGQIVRIAREWALDEIDVIKGDVSIFQELQINESKLRERAALLSFARAAEVTIKGMRVDGVSMAHCDRLDKLFTFNTPLDISERKLSEITLDHIEGILTSPRLTFGNRKALRSFLKRILEIPDRYGVHSAVRPWEISEIGQKYFNNDKTVSQLLAWTEQQYASLIEFLGSEAAKWQQAYCLRLYLLMDAPLSQLMAARWDDLYVYPEKGNEGEKGAERFEWRHNDQWRGRVSIRAMNNQILKLCLKRGREEFGNTPFWFPSSYNRTVGHIRSVDHVWRLALAKHELKYLSPRIFREVFKQNCPAYGRAKSTAPDLLTKP